MHRINHSVAFSKDGACTNQAESYFSRLRRAEFGQRQSHQRPIPARLCIGDCVAREDNRRVSNGEQYSAVTALGRLVIR